MNIGALRHQLTIKAINTTEDSYGEVTEDPTTTECTVWGSIEPLSGRELLLAQQIQATVTHRVRIRYHSGLDPSMQIVFGTRTFDILSIINLEERNRELEIMCREVL